MSTDRKMLTKKEAEELRRYLKAKGYDRVAGSGRGSSWTRHIKGDHMVFVQKSWMTGAYSTWDVTK